MRSFNAAERGQPKRTVKLTREQDRQISSVRTENRLALSVVQIIDALERDRPDQVRGDVTSVTARQWIILNDEIRGIASTVDTGLRRFERWKTNVRAAGLEANHAAVEVVDSGNTRVPTFDIDTRAARDLYERASKRLRDLESAVGIRRREHLQDEVADELGVESATVGGWIEHDLPYTVEGRPGGGHQRVFDLEEVREWVEERLGPLRRGLATKELAARLGIEAPSILAWADEGMPHSRRTFGKNATRYFDLEEVKEWLRKRGGRGAMAAARLMKPEDLRRMINEIGLKATAKHLGVSETSLIHLREELDVAPPGERVSSWRIATRKELVDALEKHEGRRGPIMEELGLSAWELRKALGHHGLMEHELVLHPTHKQALPFTKDELLASIESHVGRRDAIAQDLGVSRGYLRAAILDLGLEDHPLLQSGKIPSRVSRSIESKKFVGRTARGSEHEFSREETLVPFWLAAIREVMARHPGRGGGRATAAEIGISPVSLTNMLQGKRVPGYEVMTQIMAAVRREPPDWKAALEKALDEYRTPVERARGLKYSSISLDAASSILDISPDSIAGLLSSHARPSMSVLQKILEAAGEPYLVEAIVTPETTVYGGRGAEPERTAEWRRTKAAEVLRAYKAGSIWSKAIEDAGLSEGAGIRWAKEARQGRGPFAEVSAKDPAFQPLPWHLAEGSPEPYQGFRYGPWSEDPPKDL
jgi:transcriptional regulator with XRE-family HTH domain